MGELNQQNQNGLDQRQLSYVKEIEQTYIKRIETILEPIFGKGNARAEVTAELDFAQREQTSENYTPNSPPNAAAIRSQQMHAHHSGAEHGGSGARASGHPQKQRFSA